MEVIAEGAVFMDGMDGSADMGAAFREDATDEEIAAALRDRFFERTSCARGKWSAAPKA